MLRSTRRNKKRNGFVEMDFIRYGMADGKRIHTGSSHLPDRNQDILERLMKDGNIYYCNDNFYSSGRSSIFRYKEQGGRQKFLRMRRKLRRRVSRMQEQCKKNLPIKGIGQMDNSRQVIFDRYSSSGTTTIKGTLKDKTFGVGSILSFV